jgi:sugar-specific transcriptional regulator TrmB
MNPILIKKLIDVGLSEHEAKVYVASLSLGPTSVLKLSRAAGVKRTTVYSIIETLKQRGLMRIEFHGLKQVFVAESPEKLTSVLEFRKHSLQTIMPEFLALYHLRGGESTIKYYEGLEGVKSVYERLIAEIRPHEDYLVIAQQEQWYELDRDYFQDFIERRAKLPIRIRMLMQDSATAREFKKFERNYHMQTKILPPETFLVTNVIITPQRVVIHQLIPPISAIVIENKSTIQLHQQLFEVIWQSIP